MFIGTTANLQDGLFAGFMAGFTYVAAAIGITYLFEFRSFKLWAICECGQVLPLEHCEGAVPIPRP